MVIYKKALFALSIATWLAVPGCDSAEPTPAGETAGADATSTASETGDVEPAETSLPAEPPPPPRVVIETSQGAIVVQLDADRAPLSVENFLWHAERGDYEATTFHQVVADYVLVGGGFTADRAERPAGPSIRNEAHNGLSNRRGTIAMARSPDSIDSAANQFFINLGDNAELDHRGESAEEYGYCVFGEVVEGLDVCERIAETQVHDEPSFEQTPVETVLIESVRRLR